MAARRHECFICMDISKNPKLIACQHSFCCKCLEDYVQINLLNGKFNCPICRTCVELPVGGVSALQSNFCIDINAPDKVACDICGPRNVACSRCLECEENLCQTCCYAHEKSKATRHHKISDLGRLDSETKGIIRQRIFCDQHPEVETWLFCRDCQALICLRCKVVKHENHATEPVSDAAGRMSKILETKLNECSDRLRSIIASKRMGEELDKKITEAEQEELNAVDDQGSQLYKAIYHELEKVKARIANVYHQFRQQNAVFRKDVEEELNMCSNAKDNAQRLIYQGTDIDIIKKGTVVEQLISAAISKTEQTPNTRLEKKLFSPAEIKQDVLISLVGTMEYTTEIGSSEWQKKYNVTMGCIDSKCSHTLSPPLSATQVSGTVSLSDLNIQVGDTSRPLPSPPFKKDERLYYRALHDFDVMSDDDLSFKKGDRLKVDVEASQNCDRWVASHTETKETDYNPSNYVDNDKYSPQAQDWWNNLDRKEADKQLLLPGNPTGTFLVREIGDKSSLVLSVRDLDQKLNDACVKHYRIRRLEDGGYFISPKRTFRNMLDLIQHYQSSIDGLCCQLLIACPKVRPLVQFTELEVNRESVKLVKILGKGCFGDVYAGKWRNTVDVAVKSLKPGHRVRGSEAELIYQLNHIKLVQFLAVCTQSEPIWIITELMVHGSLLDYLRKDEGKLIKLKEICDMAAQMAYGMAYLEKENFVHGNLRAANILVGGNSDVKISDFGLRRLIQKEIYEAHENTKFQIRWTAPEAAFNGIFSIKSDVWSFGVLLYELASFGRVPYPGMSGHEVLSKVDKGYRMPKPAGGPVPVPDPYYDTMLKCWNKVPESRPTFVYLQDFFDNLIVSTEGEYQ